MGTDSTRGELLEVAERLRTHGILSRSLHGNISLRSPAGDSIWISGSSLAGLREEDLAELKLNGEIVSGQVADTEREVIRMHTIVYERYPDARCVIHTHSPYATAYAVASLELPVFAESLARWGVSEPIPVAKWAPRGSDASVENIVAAVERAGDGAPAVLLENHGVLGWGRTGNEAVRRAIALEENAELGVLAESIGGAQRMSREMAKLAEMRKVSFVTPEGA